MDHILYSNILKLVAKYLYAIHLV
uniref:Uncharacterized protein n=1 Tax=Rhizophora mucronata TaxID=61149 RepID=A0A2P2PU43_RHIMU